MKSSDKPISDKPVLDQPVLDKPVSDKPVSDKPVSDKPGVSVHTYSMVEYCKVGNSKSNKRTIYT